MKNLEKIIETVNDIFDGDLSRCEAIDKMMALVLNRKETDSTLKHKHDTLLMELTKLMVEVKQELKETECIHTINYLSGKKAILQFALNLLS
jgi:hypothetical protein